MDVDDQPDHAQVGAFAEAQHAYVGNYIQLADGKALAVFAWVSALFAYLVSNADFLSTLRSPECSLVWLLVVATTLTLIASAALAAAVVLPRLWSGQSGLVFWGATANYSSDAAYSKAVHDAGAQLIAETRLANVYHLARVCARKYRLLRLSMWGALIGFASGGTWFIFAS